MNIFITGACGYQGSKLIPKLLNLGHNVVALDTQWFGINLKKHKNLKIIKKNVLNIEEKDLKKIDFIFHLASIANDNMGDLRQEITWEISCLGTMKLLEFAIKNKVKKIIFASSASVYGIKKEKLVTEKLSLEPISVYNKAKMITERTLLSYSNYIDVCIIRPATVCGLSPRMRFDLSVNMLTYQALKNNVITVFGGSQIRPNIHLDDLIDIYLFFLKRNNFKNGIFNAGFENLSILNIAKKVTKYIPAKIRILKNNKDKRSYRIDSSKILKTGYKPNKKVNDAIEEINNYYSLYPNMINEKCFSVDWLKKNQYKFL